MMSAPFKPVSTQSDIKALLKISRGSYVVPIVIFVITAIAFLAFWLAPGRVQLANEFERICKSLRAGGVAGEGIGTNAGVIGLALKNPPQQNRSAKATEPGSTQPAQGAIVADAPAPRWPELKPGDLIVAVNGIPVGNVRDAVAAINASIAKTAPVSLTVRRAVAPQSGSTGAAKLTLSPTPETLPGILPPSAPARVDSPNRGWVNGAAHYRDWCISPAGGTFDELKADFVKRRNVWDDLPLQSFALDDMGGIRAMVRIGIAYGKVFLDDLFAAIREYWWQGLLFVVTSALFALVPGIAGMIYRRSFWTWFGIAFVSLLAFRAMFTNIGQLINHGSDTISKTSAAVASEIVIFALAQLAVLLLTQRLRRHSSRPPYFASMVPLGLYNRGVQLGLLVLGIGIIGLGWGQHVFDNLPVQATWAKWNFVLFGLPFIYFLLKVAPNWPHTGPKNIVVCLDGTSNTPDQLELGLSAQTNVFKLFGMLKSDPGGSRAPNGQFDTTLCKSYKDKQIALYYTGVGNKYDNDPLVGTLAQATGLGAMGIIERAYLDVMRVWRPGDRLFIFGFSRGAASARILSRVIDQRGAPAAIWSLRLFGRHWTLWPSSRKRPVPINVLACWDTVGAFGVAKTIAGIDFQKLAPVHDLTVPENVEQAYHLVALDEERREFEPTLMDPDPIRPERIVEVWFAGSHASVGGGWATDRLSDVALDFVLRRVSSGYCADGTTEPGADQWGLHLTAANAMNAAAAAKAQPGMTLIHPDPLGQLRTYISGIYNYRPRQMPLHAVISETVFERMTKSMPVYAPQALFDLNDALDAKRDLITEKVKKLEETRSMAENERAKVLEFTDKLRLTRFPQYWAEVLAARQPGARPVDPAIVLSNARPPPPVAG